MSCDALLSVIEEAIVGDAVAYGPYFWPAQDNTRVSKRDRDDLVARVATAARCRFGGTPADDRGLLRICSLVLADLNVAFSKGRGRGYTLIRGQLGDAPLRYQEALAEEFRRLPPAEQLQEPLTIYQNPLVRQSL